MSQKILYVKEENKPLIEKATAAGKAAGLKSFSDIVFSALEQYTYGLQQKQGIDFTEQEVELEKERIRFVGRSFGTKKVGKIAYSFFVTAKGRILVHIQTPEETTYSTFETTDEMVKHIPAASSELIEEMKVLLPKPVKWLDI
ncbi:hypothetical protein GCM10007416_34180 [Kroppenstedtia guangzhouensis]|uniref:Uncharacterized protein n=1 Tax=Kroppenstedtia guangzhouensis TaxID=1274356 RepID=A0ABQ1H461_9BACL|nr:hypothetical protein [Kroppenstedtia guangzhouensis]GGA58137.1 hypothetical protein GCM10007416_34180 [Kroppenstedtia guangzhouensis]